ncbi:hypothetical protein GWL_29040 [Herbaspirillum sp. GW103]|nr:hypothetical protein GWL_29040 [Herbaspirillum sp. GW103]
MRCDPVLGCRHPVQAACPRQCQGQSATPDDDRTPAPSHLPLPPKMFSLEALG